MRLRPSSFNTLKHCTGYLLLDVPNVNIENDASLEGTKAHKLLEEMLKGSADTTGYDSEMIMYAKGAVNYIVEKSQGNPVNVEVKRKFSKIHPDCEGTPDVDWYDPITKTYHVFDYKYGFVGVEAKDNLQLITYATEAPVETAYYCFHIYQPRAYSADGPAKRHVMTKKDFWEVVSWLRDRLEMALDPKRAYTRAGEHCRNCKGFTVCNTIDTAIKSGLELTGRIESDDSNLGIQLLLLRKIAKLAEKKLERLE